MNIGHMRHRIELQSPSIDNDATGGNITTWENLGSYWAELTPLGGSEHLAHDKISSRLKYRIKLRYNSAITADMRFKYGERYFQINNIYHEDEKKNHTICLCLSENDKNL